MPRTNGRHRRDRGHMATASAFRSTAAVLAGMVVAAPAASTARADAPDVPTASQVPGSLSAESVSATLDSLQRQAVELHQQVLDTYAAYQQAKSNAAKRRAEYARAAEES